jgi:putative Holliday junction resolvase
MARIIAFDFGTKRTGIAVTDSLGIIAGPLAVVEEQKLFEFIRNYFSKENIGTIVIGKPIHLSGEESGPLQALNNFTAFFKNHYPNIPLVFIDERFTSVMAQKTIIESGINKKARRDKSLSDRIAAVLILQSYLEQKDFGNWH